MMSPSATFRTKTASRLCAIGAGAIGATGLMGWIFDVPVLQRIHPALVTMKANTAIALMLAALSLWLLQEENVAGVKRWLAQGCAALVALLGLVTLGEILFSWDAGIDQLLFRESLAAAAKSFPGRMGIMSALVLSCVGLALLLLDTKIAGRHWAGVLAFGATFATTLVFLIYFYDIALPEPWAKYLTIGLHTVPAFFGLSAGLLLARPQRGAMAALTGSSTSCVVARRMLPTAFFLPILLGWVVRLLTRDFGSIGPGVDLVIFVVITILLFCGLVVGTVRAIDRQEALTKAAQLALQRSEANLRDFVDNATVGLHWVGLDGTILWANKTELDTLGYARAEYVGHPIAKFHADEATINDILARLTRGEAVRDYAARVRRKDGAIRDVVISSNALFEDGKFIHTRCFTRDITEQKIAESARARLAAIVDWSNDAIIGKTLEGIITSWNFGAEKVFGYTATEAIGQSILILIPPERQNEEPEIRARIAQGESVTPFESVRLRKDGSRIHVSATISPVKDSAGNVIGASKVARDITDRKQAEGALRESHERTANILESITDGFCALDQNWRFTYLNGQAELILQPLKNNRAALLGRNLWSEFPDLVGTLVEKNFHRARTDQTTVHFEMFYPPLAVWLQLRAYPSKDGLSVYFQDISARKETESLLLRYRLLAEKARDIVWMARLDGEIVEINQAAVNAYGYSREELLGMNLRQLRDRSTLPQLPGQLEKAATGGVHFETIHVRKDGTPFSVEENATSAEVGGETLILSIVRDITERVDAREALRESGERFRTMADNMAQFAWMADATGWIFWYNQRWFDYTGTTLEEMQGWDWKAVQHPDHVDRVVEKIARHWQSGEVWEDTFPLRGKDGNYRWFLSRAIPIRDAGGNILRWFGTNTDVTEQRDAAEELEEALQKVETASRAKDDFLAALSHELRTPLTPVLLCAAALRDDERLPSDVREQLAMMERNIALEARLIDDLLDLTMIVRGKLPLRPEQCDAHSLIGLALEMVRDAARAKDIVIERAFAAKLSGLTVDPARFQQVIWNLLRNAVKFTPEHGRISITTRNETNLSGAQRLHIEVADTGIGIERAHLAQIFRPFDQGGHTGSHRFGGLGLGLAIARAVVELHGGIISVQSEGANRGTTFSVILPDAVAPHSGLTDSSEPFAAAATANSSPAPNSAPSVASLRLLLVEDHESTIKTLTLLLQRDGHRVVAARTVALALEAAAHNPFDLVISDLGLPDGTGNELMEKLRADYGLRGIALSGYGMEEDLRRSRQAGFAAHIVKPIPIADLRRVIAALTAAGK